MRIRNEVPEREYLNELFFYNHDSGSLIWKRRPRSHFNSNQAFNMWNTRYCNKEAVGRRGRYLSVSIDRKRFYVHRIVWKLCIGDTVPEAIDHIDGNPDNNRLENLRDGSGYANSKNVAKRIDNTSGVAGVTKRSNGTWMVRMSDDGNRIYMGCFGTFEEAVTVEMEERLKLNYTKRHGR